MFNKYIYRGIYICQSKPPLLCKMYKYRQTNIVDKNVIEQIYSTYVVSISEMYI